MAKPIFMSESDIELALRKAIEQAAERMKQKKCLDKFSISIDLAKTKKDDRLCDVYFTPLAWAKVATLVAKYTTEVQWHGLTRRISETEFEIYDIIVPPHAVSGTTVISDDVEYCAWLNDLDDDTFYDLRAHGHSHVSMAVTPSGVDDKYREDLITQMPRPKDDEDAFYIFFIVNKSHAISAEVFDLKYNAHYSNAEIVIDVLFDDGTFMGDFIDEAKKVAKVATPKYNNGYGYGGYNGYSGYNGGTYSKGAAVTPAGKSSKASSKSKDVKAPTEGGKYFGYDTMAEYLEQTGISDYEAAGYDPDDVNAYDP